MCFQKDGLLARLMVFMSDVAGRNLAINLYNAVGRNLAWCMTRMLIVKMPATHSVLQRFTTVH